MGFVWSLALLVQFLFVYSLFKSIFIDCFHFVQPSQCHEDESHALLQFKEGFVISSVASENHLSYPKTSSWNASTNCCSWDGIVCDVSTGHVIGIDVSSSQLYGPIDANSTLFYLVHLQKLNLADNDFNYSQIPLRIGELSKLRYLNLSNAIFYGEIPQQVSQLSKLLSLDLSDNFDSNPKGDINLLQIKPSNLRSIINSTKLEVLLLSYVNILSPLPDMLVNLTSLQRLNLYHCGLYGEFPVGIFHLPNLRYLVLASNQHLTGRLPDFQSNALSILELGGTGFYGAVPTSIGKLSSLTRLSISGCNFFGTLPSSLGNLTQLTFMELGFNNFTVETFSWISKLSSIHYLDLSSLNIGSDNEIPLYFANLTQLRCLIAEESGLTGEFPSWITNLTNLSFLDLVMNNLHGEIPNSFFRLENIETLELSNNSLHGELELDMFLKFKKLTYLDLSFNKLSLLSGKSSSNWSDSGILALELASCNLVEFPTFIRDLGDLEGLDLSYNSLTSLPSWLWRKASLQSLTISHSSLTGEISPSICNLNSLEHLDLSFNNLSDEVPSCLGNFSEYLNSLMLKGNQLSSLIPQSYLIGNEVQMIDFSNNNLHGQLPRALVNCEWLEYFDVSHNNINDSFPFWLGDLPELKVLALRDNKFHGTIRCFEKMTCTFPKLHIIDLSRNDFSGSLPSEMIQSWESMKTSKKSQLQYEQLPIKFKFHHDGGNWVETNTYKFTMSNKGVEMAYPSLQKLYYMIAVDISSNKISGEIPKVIGDLTSLVFLNLSNNMLMGSIPSSLEKLSELEALDLSLNNLSGKIPQQLTQLTFLEFFNVSFNNLSGPIPQNKQFSTFQGNSFDGNQGLCGDQSLKKCGGPSLDLPSASDVDEDSDSFIELDWKIVFIGYAGGLVAGVALGWTFSPEIFRWLKRIF